MMHSAAFLVVLLSLCIQHGAREELKDRFTGKSKWA